MPQLVTVDPDDGTIKYVGVITEIKGPITDEATPEVEVYEVTAVAFPDTPFDYDVGSTLWKAL